MVDLPALAVTLALGACALKRGGSLSVYLRRQAQAGSPLLGIKKLVFIKL